MNISGSLHLYSGTDRELFFTFDDDVAQQLYSSPQFNIEDKDTRRAFITGGNDRFIHRRTLSFSRKQSEIKVSLCKETTKDGLGALTELYDWFAPSDAERPEVVRIVGTFSRKLHEGVQVWELALQEPVDLISPPGLKRRRKTPSKTRKAFLHRREIQERELRKVGRLAEKRTLSVLETHFPGPSYSCLWRDGYLDSEKEDIRKLGIICDIDIWSNDEDRVEAFYEIKAQQVGSKKTLPMFFLSSAEWRSLRVAKQIKVSYRIWLVQYANLDTLRDNTGKIKILELGRIEAQWVTPEVVRVVPVAEAWRVIHPS